MTALRFVTRQNCQLCDDGKARVDRWAARLGYEVRDVDVDADPALAERYGDRVPVLLAGERVVADGRMPGSRLVAGLLRLRLEARADRGGGTPPAN